MGDVRMDVALIRLATGQFDAASARQLVLNGLDLWRIESLDTLSSLTILDLSENRITSLEGLQPVIGQLKKLELQHNRLQSLEGLEAAESLEVLRVEGNQVRDIEQVKRLTSLKKLRTWYMQAPDGSVANPVCNHADYPTVSKGMPSLRCMDGKFFLGEGFDPRDLLHIVDQEQPEFVLPPPQSWVTSDYWKGADAPPVRLPVGREAEFRGKIQECNQLLAKADSNLDAFRRGRPRPST